MIMNHPIIPSAQLLPFRHSGEGRKPDPEKWAVIRFLGGWLIFFILVVSILVIAVTYNANAYTGRRAVLYTNIQVMLAENPPWVWGTSDCSMQVWKLIKDLWPELRLTKWFHRDRATVMATWPWPPLMSLEQAIFGDLLFANSEDYPKSAAGTARKDFDINHILVQYIRPGTAVHAGKKRGFSETNLRPYWQPRIVLAVRPPY